MLTIFGRAGAALAAGLALIAASAHAGLAQGPMVQAVTHDQAGVWLRTSMDQPVRLMVTAPDGTVSFTDPAFTSLADADSTARFMLTGLAAGATYTYQVGTTDPDSGDESWTGSYAFRTPADDVASMNIAVLADFRNKLTPSTALQSAVQSRPDVLAVIGDLDHRDPANAPGGGYYALEDADTVLANMRAMHRDTRDPANALGAGFFPGIVGAPDTGVPQIPMVYAWDDHDFCSNNSDLNCPFAPQSFRAYDEYYIRAPDNAGARGCEGAGVFESLSYGTLVQLFFLDARSARDEGNPEGDTAMLGACQHAWLVDGLHASTATWKIVLSPVPLNPSVKTWDSWANFPVERAALLDAIADVPNVVFVSGDLHSGGAIDDGTASGHPEVSTPHAGMPATWVNTWCRVQGDTVVSRPGTWTLGGRIDPNIDAASPTCLGKTFPPGSPVDGQAASVYPLAGASSPGYLWITAATSSLTVTVRDSHGRAKKGYRADGKKVPMKLQLH